MTLASLLTLISLYPWNLQASGYYTIGDYSSGQKYTSQSVYVAMDRKLKDYFVLGYEHVRIESDYEDYVQENVLFRSGFMVANGFSPSFLAGRIQSNGVEDGWLLGTQIDGSNRWFGYSAGYIYSEFNGLHPDLYDQTFNSSTQWRMGLSRALGNNLLQIGIINSRVDVQTTDNLFTLGYDVQCCQKLFFSSLYAFGKGHFIADPVLLTIDNNQDPLTSMFRARLSVRITPNLSLLGNYSRRTYTPGDANTLRSDYSAQYYIFGASIRI